MAPVNEDRELDAPWAAQIVERIHRGARGASAEEHVIHQHHRPAIHIKRDDRRMHFGGRLAPHVVSVHAHVQTPHRHRVRPDVLQDFDQPLGQVNAAPLHPDDGDGLAIIVSLRDLMANPCQDAMDGGSVQNDGFLRHDLL